MLKRIWQKFKNFVRQQFCMHHFWASDFLVTFDDRGAIHQIDQCVKCGKRERQKITVQDRGL